MADSANQSEGRLSRRKYVQAIVGATMAGAAGCNQGGGDGGDGGDGSGGGNETTTEEPTQTTTQGPPVNDTMTFAVDNVPESSQFNPYAPSGGGSGGGWDYLQELVSPRRVTEVRSLLSNHSYDASWIDGRDTIEIPTMVKDYDLNPPFEVTRHLDERLTYWDGTPLDAEARQLESRADYFYNNGKFDDASTLNSEAVDQWTFRWWHNKGEAEGQEANPTNGQVLDTQALPAEPPFHPEFHEPYVEQWEDASNEDAVATVNNEIENASVTFTTLAEEGWASGLYRIESADDISAERATARMRDDHPIDFATIPKMEYRFASADRENVLAGQGEIDIGPGIVAESSSEFNREMLPDYVQEIDRFLSNGGDQMAINWNNKHLGRLWVRRAMIAAVDWEAVGANGWGPAASLPVTHHNGMLQSVAESNFSEEFLDSLYTYPMEADQELAAEWMRKGGYTKEGDVWTDWTGDSVELTFIGNAGIPSWTGGEQTVQSNLQEFGFAIDYSTLEGNAFNSAHDPENLNYDMSFMWLLSPVQVWNAYTSDAAWWGDPLIGANPNTMDAFGLGDEAETDAQGKPLQVQIPSETGSIEAPDRAGKAPDLPDGEEIDLLNLITSFTSSEITEERFMENARKCARYYNYYVPDFIFHQYAHGLWGNVRDFKFPPRGHPANRTWTKYSNNYQAQTGIPQVKYNQEYEPPQ